jgi:two-component system, LytTR family, response regulator
MRLNCVVVDDSTIQRLIITKLVTNNLGLKLLADFSNAIEAKNFISNNEVDLVLLDVEMPDLNGFDLLDGLKNKPKIIFISSKAEYALKAFDYEAADYLKKPIEIDRFNIAIKKVVDLSEMNKNSADETGDFIYVKTNLKKIKVYLSKIKWIEAFGDYLKVITEEESMLVLSTMKSFENELPKNQFVRVHKSYIVNINKIVKYDSKSLEIGKTKIPLSRNRKEDLRETIANSQ